MKRKVILLMSIFCFKSWSALLDFKPVALAVQPKDTLTVRGFDGDVKFTISKSPQLVVKVKQENHDKASGAVKQSIDEWNFSLQRGVNGIEVLVQGPAGKDVWRQLLTTDQAPKFHLEISAPSLPLEMAWRNGKVSFDGWAAPIRLGMQNGAVSVLGGIGDVRVSGHDLDLRFKDRQGRVVAETYSGKVNSEGVKGSQKIEAFSGDTVITQSEGQIEFKSFKSPLSVTGGKGRIEFQSIRGPIKVAQFQGDLKGVVEEAPVVAKLTQMGEVRIQSQSGGVVLELPDSGASLTLTSVEGNINGPSHLTVDQQAGQRVMRGRLKGSQDGSVVVKTQTGAIRVR